MGLRKKEQEYELVLYKTNPKKVELESYSIGDDIFLTMRFNGKALEKGDLLWAQNDMDAGNTDLMLNVLKVYKDGSVQVKTPGNVYVKDLRQFSKNEQFNIVATYRKKQKHGSN